MERGVATGLMVPPLTILTNAHAAGQRSMIGYGALLLDAARQMAVPAVEWRGTSALGGSIIARGRLAKPARDLDRYLLSPAALAGRRAGVAHVVDPGNVIYLDVVRAARTVATVHDMIPYLAEAGRLDGFRASRFGRRLMRAIVHRLRRVDRIVCVSEATHRDVLELVEPDPARVVTIPNAVFQPLAPASGEACAALRRRLGVPAEAPLLLHIGRNFYKNHDAVLDVAAKLAHARSDLRLVMVLPPTSAIDEAIRRRRLSERVHLVPYVQRDDMAALYTTADLLLFPSFYEGFGYPVLEAQLCGTPVIGSDAASLPEVAGAGARLFAPDDVDGMAAAAAELLGDTDARAALVAAGHANTRRFDHERWVAQHHALWRELGMTPAAGRGTPRPAA